MVLEVLIIDVDSAIDEIDSLLLFPVRMFEAFSWDLNDDLLFDLLIQILY